jgi:outer membrane protein OmpA-like peptidoglycan-associated protein
LMKLSQDRVQAVKNYMIKKGIRSDRIEGKGYGPTKPIITNDTQENREHNRRVEFRIIRE